MRHDGIPSYVYLTKYYIYIHNSSCKPEGFASDCVFSQLVVALSLCIGLSSIDLDTPSTTRCGLWLSITLYIASVA